MTKESIVSIIICTYNGAAKIPGILRSLQNEQKGILSEIIVVVDGSTDHTLNVLAGFDYITIVEQNNQGRSRAKNNGAKQAKGDLLLFFDDDMRVLPGTVQQHISHHAQFHESLLAGKIGMDPARCITDFDTYLCSLMEKWQKGLQEKRHQDGTNFTFSSAHLSLPKSVFINLGMFDEALTDAEDYDLGMRALAKQVPVFFDPHILAWHDDFPSPQKYVIRQTEYKKSHKKLYELDKKYKSSTKKAIAAPIWWKRLLLRFLCKSFWLTSIQQEKLILLPRKWRYLLYTYIIYAHTLRQLKLI